MIKKSYLLLTLLTAFLWLGSGTMWGQDPETILSEGFENNDFDSKWVRRSNASSTARYNHGNSYAHTDSYDFRFYYNTNPPQYLVSKTELSIPNNATSVTVSLYYKAGGSYTETFQVGYSTTDNENDSFTWDTQVATSSSTWAQYSNSTFFPKETKYIAIKYTANDQLALYVDDIEVSYIAPVACPKPKNLTKGAVTANSATFTWTAGASEEAWQYVCLPASSALDWTGAKTVTSATATVNGLTANTDYKFYVRSDCGSDQSVEVFKAFTTPCAGYPTASLPFEENFNNVTANTIPDCWSKIEYVSGTTSYPFVYSGGTTGNCMYFYGGGATSPSTIILPPLEEPTNNLIISFSYKNYSTSSYYGQAKLGYMTDPADASTFVTLKALTRTTSWNSTAVNKYALSEAPANSYIAIQLSGGASGYNSQRLYLDDIVVTKPSSCVDPSVVNAVASSTTSATVSWTENGSATSWNLQYSTDNFATYTTVSGITENPYTLEGLTANTTYKVRVQADCGGGEKSDWVASAAFDTPCEAVNGIGWSANFAGASTGSAAGLPGCWIKNSTNTYPYIYNYGARSNSRCLYFGGTSTAQPIAVLPPFSEATNTLYVTLWYNNAYDYGDYSASSYGQLAIGYITDPEDASTFVAQEVLARVNTYTLAQVALTDAPAGSRVAIRYVNGGSSTGYLFVDDIAITAIPSCLAPSGVSGAATSMEEASIAWTANGTESAWQVRYSSDNGESWSDAVNAGSNPFALTGLSAKTTYVAQVRAKCGDEEFSDWSASSAPFFTPCPPQAASYSFGFETAEGAVNGEFPTSECWKRITTSSYPSVYNYYAKSGSQCLRFYGSGTQYAILPQFNEDVKGLTLSFYYYNGSWGGALSVGYMTDPEDATTFVLLQDLANITAYTAAATEINLSGAEAGARYIAFKYVGSESYHASYLDDVVVEKALSCQKPTDVLVSNVTATTAVVDWTENNSAETWKLQISTNNVDWTDVNSGANVTEKPYTLTGLTANHTTYYVRVKSVCGGSDASNWSNASDPFETKCAVVAIPFNEDFSGDIDCWKKESCYSSTGLYDDAFRFYYNTYGQYPPQYLISPEINTDSKEVTVEFDYYIYSTNYPETFEVGYSTTNNEVTSFTWGASVTAENTSALKYSANLPVGVKYIAIKHTSDDQYYLYIDNFSVTEYIAPACPAVSAATLQESNVTAHTATVSWTAAGEETAWNLQYKAEDDAEWSSVIPVTASSYDLTGLAENTLYYVRVQADCAGDGTGDWTGDEAFSFPTDCDPKAVSKASPWNYGFEDAADDAFPACWDRNEAYSGHGYPIVNEDSYNANTGDKYLYFYTPARNGGPAYTEDAILPVFNTDIKNLKVSFVYKNNSTGTNYGQLAVGYVSGNEFVQVGDLLAKVDDYTSVEREMPNNAPEGARIAIRCIGSTKSGYSTYVYVDDIVVSLKPTCYTPTALAAAETSDGAVLTWTAGKDENEWNVRYSVKDADSWTVVPSIASETYTLTGLSLDVTYEVQVRAYCGENDESEWSASADFTPVCNAPSSLAVTARTMTSATFSWISSESAWVLQYSVDGENWESENVNANPYTLNNLTAGQTYQAKIQAACGSDFSNVVEFSTVCAMRSAAELPLSEDFNSVADGALPACWESATAAVEVGEEATKLFFRGADEQIVVLPGYDVALNKLSVSFDYTLNNASMQFGYVETIDGEFHSLAELEGSAFEADLTTAPAFAGYLAFRYYETTSEWAAATIDNVVVMDKSALVLKDSENNDAVLAELVDETVTITINRTIFCDGYFNTLCLPFDLDAAALAASPLAGYAKLAKFCEATVDGGADELQLVYEYATSIEAGVPYLINFPAGENIVNPTFTDVTISATEGSNANLGNGIIVKGILKPEPFTAGNEDMLFLLGENKLTWAGVTNYLKGFRAYFQLTSTPANSPVRRGMNARIVERQNMPTGIEDARGEVKSLKLLENNQVVIIRNGVKYSVQGQVIQ